MSKDAGASKQKPRLCIIVDTGEAGNRVVGRLLKLGLDVRTERLQVGDYQLSDRLIVERKTASDFLRSIADKRLFNQALEMAEKFERRVLIVEGGRLYSSSGFHPNAVKGALCAMAVQFGISVLQTRTPEETAALLATMAKQEQVGMRGISLRPKRRATSLSQQQEYIVESLPGVGPKLSKVLLEHFGTVEKVFAATEQDLEQVDLIGPKKAKALREVLSTPYVP
ncbi:MAG: ERCC4 domain-containing protein [Candidatus Bathyarchaeia archaeon]